MKRDGWIPVCRLEDLSPRRARKVDLEGMTVAVFATSHGAVLAVEDRCPHKGGPLSEGILHDDCVTCPLHGWNVSLVTGMAQQPDRGRARTVPTLVVGGEVFLRRPDRGPLVTLEETCSVHPDTRRPKLGRRRATREDFSVHDFDRDVPVLAVEPPSPDTEASLRLRVGDRVLGLDELRRSCEIERAPTHLTCLMFGFTRAVTWTGVRLADVLADAGVADAPFFSFHSWETDSTPEKRRFFETLPREYALDARTMLVFGMNDGPLPKEHGGPLRLVVPFLQGYKSVKWLTWIEPTQEDAVGYKKLYGFIEFPELAPT